MMNNDTKKIINGDIDLYEFLEVKSDSSQNEIRRQYRQKALLYHPDKNPGNENQFNLLAKAYEILSNPVLREGYDHIWNIKRNKKIRDERLDELTRNFKIELEKAEKEHYLKHNLNDQSEEATKRRRRDFNLEQLKEEGLRKKQEYESSLLRRNAKPDDTLDYISFSDIPYNKLISLKDEKSNRVVVRWKHKSELKGLFTSDVLSEIMQIFGEVILCEIFSRQSSSRYDEGIIEYKNLSDAEKATCHNYKDSAKLWDGTKVRKLASLLRECRFEKVGTEQIDIEKQRKEIKTFKEKGYIPKDFNISNEKLGAVLNELILKELHESSNPYSI